MMRLHNAEAMAVWDVNMLEAYVKMAEELPPPYEPFEADACPPDLQAFLYLLMRDLVPTGYIEGLMMQAVSQTSKSGKNFTNQHLAEYAAKIGRQLTYSQPVVGG